MAADAPGPAPTVEQLAADELAAAVIARARHTGMTVGTAESLTGGGVAAALTGVPGASSVVRGAVVSYVDAVKASVLGVPEDLLARRGAVDPDVAAAMAAGARRVLRCDLAVSTTGVAGPGPLDGQPAGTVYLGICGPGSTATTRLDLSGSRAHIRATSVIAALQLLLEVLDRA